FAPVEAPRRVLAVGDGERVVVDAPRRDEEGVTEAARERLQRRLDVGPRRRRVGDVHERIDALARELRAEGRVVGPVAHDRADPREPPGSAPAVQDHDLVAVTEQRPHDVQADKLRAPDHEHAHLGQATYGDAGLAPPVTTETTWTLTLQRHREAGRRARHAVDRADLVGDEVADGVERRALDDGDEVERARDRGDVDV